MRISIDAATVEDMAARLRRARPVALARIGERMSRLLWEEIPVVTGNLRQGVSYETRETEVVVNIAARRGRQGARAATAVNARGEPKTVTLRPQPAFDYAAAVAFGTSDIRPRRAQAVLVPGEPRVGADGRREPHVVLDGRTYVLRRRARGRRANPYHERALARALPEMSALAAEALERAFD